MLYKSYARIWKYELLYTDNYCCINLMPVCVAMIRCLCSLRMISFYNNFFFRCLVPKVVISNPVIVFSRCFLFHPYTQIVKLQNISNLPARYDLLKQDSSEYCPISYHSSEPSVSISLFLKFNLASIVHQK